MVSSSPRRKKSRSCKACSPAQVRNPETNRCVKRSGVIGRRILGQSPKRRSPRRAASPRKLKPCSPAQIRNPATNRCVKRSGAIGKKILRRSRSKGRRASPKGRRKSPRKLKPCSPIQVRNPATNRCVLRNGAIGMKILRRSRSPIPQQVAAPYLYTDMVNYIYGFLGDDDTPLDELAKLGNYVGVQNSMAKTQYSREVIAAIQVALEKKDDWLLNYLLTHWTVRQPSHVEDLMELGGKFGRQDIIKIARQAGAKNFDAAFAAGAGAGRLNMAQWLMRYITEEELWCENNYNPMSCDEDEERMVNVNWAFSKAAGGGHRDVMQWLRDDEKATDFDRAVIEAIKGGQEDIVEELRGLGAGKINDMARAYASIGNSTKVDELILAGADNYQTILNEASENGDIPMMQKMINLLGNNITQTIKYGALDSASSKGQLDAVIFMIHSGADDIDDSVKYATLFGHLNVVRYFVENYRHQIDINQVLRDAAGAGNLKIVKYTISQGATDISGGMARAKNGEKRREFNYLSKILR